MALAVKSPHKGYSCVMPLTRGRRCQPHPVPMLTEAAVSLPQATPTLTRARRSSLGLRVVVWVCVEGVFLEWENIRGGRYASGCWRAEHSRGMLLITHVHPLIYRRCYWLCFGYTRMETHPVLATCVFIMPVILALYLCVGCLGVRWLREKFIYFRTRLLFL